LNLQNNQIASLKALSIPNTVTLVNTPSERFLLLFFSTTAFDVRWLPAGICISAAPTR